MTVMSNSYIENTPHFSQEEIGAARNAFLRYEQTEQVHLLTVMPIEEAVAVLHHCSVGYVQQLISKLENEGHDKQIGRAHV